MALETFVVIAAAYPTVEAAQSDCDAVEALYRARELGDTYDAAVLWRDEHGEVSIVHKHEQSTRRGGWGGLGVGLAGGALVALFPAIGLGAGLLVGGAGGAGIGALAGHVTRGMSRGDLKELGELLDLKTAGLIIIAESSIAEFIEPEIKLARSIMTKQLRADTDQLHREIDAALGSSDSTDTSSDPSSE